MTFTAAVKTCFAKFATFSGRASRSEYWWFFLFLFLCGIAASALDALFFGAVTVEGESTETGASAQYSNDNGPISAGVSLIVFLPHLAAAWRRMHDTGRSGYFVLLPMLLCVAAGLILIFGIGIADAFSGGGSLDVLFTRLTLAAVIPTLIVLFVSPLLVLWWLTRPSQDGTNAYGPNPHEVSP